MLLALFAASSGHWMVLQSVAWTRMLVTYSHGGDFAGAVVKTFDGQHPCALCKKIERARSDDPRPERSTQQEDPSCFVAPALAALVRTEGAFWKLGLPGWPAEVRGDAPASPPPRGAAV